MAKGKVPTRDELLAFIRDSATPVGKREIARAWSLKGDQRIELKQLLRELRDSGEIPADRAKTFRDPAALSDVAVLEIVRVDDDGHLIAVPRRHDEEKDGPPPRIEIAPQASRRSRRWPIGAALARSASSRAAWGNSTGMSLAAMAIRLTVRGSLIGPMRSTTCARRDSAPPVGSTQTMSPGTAPFLSAGLISKLCRSLRSVGLTRPMPWAPSGSS